ncbi:MAG: alpha-2-macroglobulin, partial [Arenimonas sp.]
MSVPPSSDPASTEGGTAPRPLERAFGKVEWQPPQWPRAIVGKIRARPQPWLLGVLAIALAVLATLWFLRPRAPEPGALEAKVDAPSPTDYTRTPIHVDDLRIAFPSSAAAIKQVGTAPEGVSLEPELAGAWRWVDDRNLSFSPATDWPVGQHYTVTIDPRAALAPKVHLVDDTLEFDTAAFGARLVKAEFYQDPVEATLKKAVFELGFSHPVEAASLESRVSLKLEDGAGTKLPAPSFTVTYDDARLKAWVHSRPLQIPENGGKVLLAMEPGVASSLGGPAGKTRIASQVALPSLYSVTIDSASATLVDNERFEPEQILVLEFNNPMRDTEVAAGSQLWLLPERNAKRPADQQTIPYPWGESEIDESVLKQSRRLAFTALPTEREFAPLHSFRYKAPPGRRLYLRVNRGLKAFGGFILGKPFATVQQVPEYPQLLRFLGDGALLSLHGEKRVSLVARNVPRARLEIARVLPDQVQHLAFANSGSYAQPGLWSIEADSLVERQEKRLHLPADDPAKANYEGVELGQFVAPGKRGVFLLSLRTLTEYEDGLTTEQSLQRNAGSETDSRLVVLTDLGILAKKALDGHRDVFVQSLARGTPVSGARVRAVARNGETLAEGVTDGEGHARLPNLEDFTREKQAVMLTVADGEDFSFLPVGDSGRVLDYSRFDIGGEPNDLERGALDAFVFSDRGLYRPGDAVRLGLIVRAADWSTPLNGLPLELQIVDPRGSTALRQRFTLGPDGFSEAGYTPRDSAPSGTWQVYLYRIGKNDTRTAIGETSFQVREFAPDTMRVKASFAREAPRGWVHPDKLAALVEAENLFGTPAIGRRVEGSLTLRPWLPDFAQWPGYRFHDPQLAKEGYDESLGDATTDAEGHAKFDLDLEQYARATYQLAFLARAFEPGSGRAVAAQASTLVSRNDFLVGIKAGDSLDYVQRGAVRDAQLLAIGPDGAARAVPGLHAVVLERRHVSVLTRQDSGLFRYVSQERKYPVRDTALDLPAGPRKFVLPTDKPGDFVLEIRDAEGIVLNQRQWTVAGAANLSRSLDRNAELTLSLSKPRYAPGETIEISVRAPYAGRGLVTIERDKVYAHAWFQADTTASVQKITVPADFEGNGYVNVQFLRDPGSDEVFMSPLSYGVLPFEVDRTARTQPISIAVPKVNRPGAEIPVTLTTQGKARVVLFAVDEGILQVARYRTPDPLGHFFAKRAL